MNDHTYDVAILGAGIAGSALAVMLARHGVSTLLIDAGTHPRFSIGESTVPVTTLLWRGMAERFDVPELNHLAGFEHVRENISSACGIKKNFGFLYHHRGREAAPHEANQLGIPTAQIHEAHLFRQDTDAYLFARAIERGADAMQATRISSLSFDDDGVTLQIEGGGNRRARFVVDGCGPGSPFARQLGLRERACRFRTKTRSMFTHMIGVERIDDCLQGEFGHGVPMAEGTLHHLFDKGWLWVIPFDNVPDSPNPLVSVGLTLSLDKHPPTDLDPEQEFHQFIEQFPSIARQFAKARTVRPWVSTPRLQWSSTRTVAPRYAMLASTAGFIGPLFSQGLGHTVAALNTLAPRLIAASRDGDWSEQRFEPLEALHNRWLERNDLLLASAFTAMESYELWDAWWRVWAVLQIPTEMWMVRAASEYSRTRDDQAWSNWERAPLEEPFARKIQTMFERCVAAVDGYASGELSAAEATRRVRAELRETDVGPMGAHLIEERFPMAPGARRRLLLSAASWALSGKKDPETSRVFGQMVREVGRSVLARRNPLA